MATQTNNFILLEKDPSSPIRGQQRSVDAADDLVLSPACVALAPTGNVTLNQTVGGVALGALTIASAADVTGNVGITAKSVSVSDSGAALLGNITTTGGADAVGAGPGAAGDELAFFQAAGPDGARRRAIHAAEEVEDRRLAATGRAHERDGFAGRHFPVHLLESDDALRRGLVVFGYV